MAETGDVGLAGIERGVGGRCRCRADRSVFNCLAEGGERCGGVLRSLLRADRGAEHVVEIRDALRGRNGVAAADVRLVDEALIAAAAQRKAVPEEVLDSGGLGTARPTTVTIVRAGELSVDMVVVGVLPFALGDGQHLVEITVAVGLVALLDEAARRVVGVLGRHAVGGG